MVIRGRAPLRVSFGGGGTDVAPFCEEQGGAIIMISSELPEVLSMSNRVLTVCDGRITGELSPEEVDPSEIMDRAIG